MKPMIISLLALMVATTAYAATMNFKFVNQTNSNLTFIPQTSSNPANCFTWPTPVVDVPAKSSMTYQAPFNCGVGFAFIQAEFVLQTTTSAKPVSILFECATDMGGCSMQGINFPIVFPDQKIGLTDGSTNSSWNFILKPIQ